MISPEELVCDNHGIGAVSSTFIHNTINPGPVLLIFLSSDTVSHDTWVYFNSLEI